MPRTDDDAPEQWPGESVHEFWIRARREHYLRNHAAAGSEPTERSWKAFLSSWAFILLEEAHTLMTHSIDPSGSVGAQYEASCEISGDLRTLTPSPVFETMTDVPYDEIEERVEELRAMPYKEYLATPEWGLQRRRAWRRAERRCELCGCGDRLDVHHRTYENRGDEEDGDLIVLCRPCHTTFHRKLRVI